MSAKEPGRTLHLGRIVRQDARGCRVRLDEGGEWWCSVRGRVHFAGAVTATTTVAVGDRVHVRPAGHERGAIEDVLTRTNVLARPEPVSGRRKNVLRQRVLAANVDRVVAVSSAAEPGFEPGLVDRLLVAAEWSWLTAVVVVNKMDLATAEPPELAVYRRLGYPVILASATTGRGIPELRAALKDRASVVAGHSGVGKTSLLNAVEPGLGLAVGRLNPVTLRGRQTTSASVWVPLSFGGAVVDTPGIREFGLYNVPPNEVTRLFRDLAAVAARCRFGNCRHATEPGCAVPAALASGEVAPWRFASYRRLLETLPDVSPWSVPD